MHLFFKKTPLFFLLAFFLGIFSSHAQLGVHIQLDRKDFLAYEPIPVKIVVTNRSGRSIKLKGPGRLSWLSFNITHGQTQPLTDSSPGIPIQPVLLEAGQSLPLTIILNNGYNLSQPGNYRIAANIYFPPGNEFYNSKSQQLSISNGLAFWNQTFGYQDSKTQKFQKRNYALLTYYRKKRTHLYARIKDESTGQTISVKHFGRLIRHQDPQAVIDREGNLHTLFLSAPNIFGYIILSPEGQALSSQAYRQNNTDRPKLFYTNNGDINLRGGTRYLPSQQQSHLNKPKARSLSERPPLPTGL